MISDLLTRAAGEALSFKTLIDSGILRADPPWVLAKAGGAVARYGAVGAALSIAAARYPDRVGIRDELGDLTYADLERRSNALANEWRARGLEPGSGVALLIRNHRGFVDAFYAAAKCGARTVLLNTDFAGPQIREVCAREGVDLLVHDEEYTAMVGDVPAPLGRFLAWTDAPGPGTIESLIRSGDDAPPPRVSVHAKIVILTSGTTGTPKGAQREEPKSLLPFGGLFGKVPFRSQEVMEGCAPMFHALGLTTAMLGVTLGHTLVLRRRFDAVATLESIEQNRVTTVVAVPAMLSRMVEAAPEHPRDTSSLRIVFMAGSQLGADLCLRATETFGPVLYNLYGSTEVAYATIGTPEELAIEPGSVGSPCPGVVVRLFDDEGREVPRGVTGRIFVRNVMPFSGYTGGGGKEVIDGLMSTGDVGHFDGHGFLHIDGRDDDMIVSGGENLFPGEVEELIATHPDVVEASCIGVDDEKFGKRLHAFVVQRESGLTEDAVKDYVKDNLARFKVPRAVTFLDELPRNPTGKVLKRKLQELT
ncbi:acyl-CoA synthetase [Nocardioides marmorisolisilvae]|uniref:Acyl-CoA synthetase n=1 Tax=Nocardioides marmorisolisilvae TaxID=1542737 RepID=A0A3N0E025_9ACTN|nr:acyl-CoA synthetase [Nocardioides marmorisolisilvae]RNL81113.1 acyl-CoA synthetase [Nocardioides marmorisolisilvae]